MKVLLAFIGTLTWHRRSGDEHHAGIGYEAREIGVEKALGAGVAYPILAEALAITAVGGIAYRARCAVSIGVGRLTFYSAVANAEAADIRLIIDSTIVVVATVILAFVGLISGHAAATGPAVDPSGSAVNRFPSATIAG